ncbi:hypothetical protein ARMGADRAFT_1013783 [Armillaria gallica]|uniref:Uncharacterized protein n=1 Tax=Armillaria gallica TaxID=47427 RepID=A0A2H3D7Y5_ARMGA|nr:hypothetical protein ARMGADRAFT_1013783 [Armillaria gallica]
MSGIAITLDISCSPLFPQHDYVAQPSSRSFSSSSSSSSSSAHSSAQSSTSSVDRFSSPYSSELVSLLLSRSTTAYSASAKRFCSTVTRLSEQEKPLPALPLSCSPRIPPHEIISFLDLMEALDADVDIQVLRIKEHIDEARKLVLAYKEERETKQEQTRKDRELVKSQTKEIGSDFWLGV